MMEFTLSRVVMGFCGLIVLASLLYPLSAVYDGREDVDLQSQCDNISDIADAFGNSGMWHMELQGSDIIPEGCILSFYDRTITLTCGDREYHSLISYGIYSSEQFTTDDVLMFTNDEVVVSVVKAG